MTIKFVLKCLSAQDDTHARILQIEESFRHPYHPHLLDVKKFLKYKHEDLQKLRINDISLSSLTKEQFTYEKNEVLRFVCREWNNDIRLDLPSVLINDPFSVEDPEELYQKFQQYIKTENTVLHNPLFQRTDKRQENTNLADFLHGRCLRFQSFAHSILRVDKATHFPFCLECCKLPDSPFHKILECPSIPDTSLRTKNLMEIIEMGTNFHLHIIYGGVEKVETDIEVLMELALRDEESVDVRAELKRIVSDICKYSDFSDQLLNRLESDTNDSCDRLN